MTFLYPFFSHIFFGVGGREILSSLEKCGDSKCLNGHFVIYNSQVCKEDKIRAALDCKKLKHSLAIHPTSSCSEAT